MRRKEQLYLWYGLAGFFFGILPLVSDFATFHDVPRFASGALTNGLIEVRHQ